MTIKAVFFDLDGTLLDTSLDLGSTLNTLLTSHHKSPLAQELIRPHVSNGASALIKLGFGDDLTEAHLATLRAKFLDIYQKNIAVHTCAFPGITKLLQQLKSNALLWGIVTNKPSLYTKELLTQYQFDSTPAAVVCPDDVGIAKPDPKPLLHACDLAGCQPDQAIYIGDHLRDIKCGRNANMPTISVGYGFTQTADEHKNWGATHNVATADEIWPIIQRHYLSL